MRTRIGCWSTFVVQDFCVHTEPTLAAQKPATLSRSCCVRSWFAGLSVPLQLHRCCGKAQLLRCAPSLGLKLTAFRAVRPAGERPLRYPATVSKLCSISAKKRPGLVVCCDISTRFAVALARCGSIANSGITVPLACARRRQPLAWDPSEKCNACRPLRVRAAQSRRHPCVRD